VASNSFTVKRNGLADQVVERVRELVRGGTYREGDRLPAEPELCDLFGVGRSTVREAMRVLANRGVVNVRHGGGTYVATGALRESFEERLARARLQELYEARLALEMPLAELAALRHSAHDVAKMRQCLKRRAKATKAGDVAAYGEADFAFHLAVAEAAKSPALFDVYRSFLDVARPQIESSVDPEYLKSENDPLHDRLCDAIAHGDLAKTRRLVRTHLTTSLEGLAARRTIEPGEGAAGSL
jgi:GntR family transcriptional repressor for pyruvate dehydrogenase complex